MDVQAALPVKPAVFQILLMLMDEPLHGYAVMQGVTESTAGEVRLLPGALYRHLQRMQEDGLIEEVPDPDGSDTRRRRYAVTQFGRAVAEAEAARMAQWVRRAAEKNLIGQPVP